MSGSGWLKSQRKNELVEIAEQVGLKNYESLKKADLESALEDHMRANQDTLSKNTSLAPFYKRVGGGAAAKKDTSSSTAVVEVKTPAVKKRVSKAKDELAGAVSDAATAVVKTPSAAAKQLIPANVPLPPSPAAVASHIDRQLTRGKSRLNQVIKNSGLSEYTDSVRDNISSAAAVQSIAVVLEAIGVINETLPRKRIFAIPAIGVYIPEYPIRANNMFNLLTVDFWAPFTFWFLTSVGLPLLFSFFFNLGLKAKNNTKHVTRSTHPAAQFDPLTFNLSKALIQWLIYTQSATISGWPSLESKARIENAVPFGHQGVLVASGLGVILSLYEAVLRK